MSICPAWVVSERWVLGYPNCIFACAAWYLIVYYVGIFSLVVWMVEITIP